MSETERNTEGVKEKKKEDNDKSGWAVHGAAAALECLSSLF